MKKWKRGKERERKGGRYRKRGSERCSSSGGAVQWQRTAAAVVIQTSYQPWKKCGEEQEEIRRHWASIIRTKWDTIDKTQSAAWFRLRRAQTRHITDVWIKRRHIYTIYNRIFSFASARRQKKGGVKTLRERKSNRDTKEHPRHGERWKVRTREGGRERERERERERKREGERERELEIRGCGAVSAPVRAWITLWRCLSIPRLRAHPILTTLTRSKTPLFFKIEYLSQVPETVIHEERHFSFVLSPVLYRLPRLYPYLWYRAGNFKHHFDNIC